MLTLQSINQLPLMNNSHPKSLAIHDLNNDTILDIAVANSGNNNIGILLGKGDGTFQSEITYSTGTDSQPLSIIVADLNNDHRLDIMVANFAVNNIGILFGNGDGTFQDQRTFSTGTSRPLWISLGDFDNDSQIDIVMINYGMNSISVLLNYNNEKFANKIILSTGYDSLPSSAVVVDFNNDQKLDIAVTNSGTHNVMIFYGDGNGSFPIEKIFSLDIGSQPSAIGVGDFNDDTKLDLAVANYGTNNVFLLFGDGNGTFIVRGIYLMGNDAKPISIVVGHFDNDNHLDIAVSNAGTNDIKILFQYENGYFTNQKSYSTGLSSKPISIATSDLNSDDRLDIIVVNYATNNVFILLSYVNITLSSQRTYTANRNSALKSNAVGDLNNDTFLDIVVVDNTHDGIDVFFGNADGTFSQMKIYSTGNNCPPLAVVVDDFNKDNIFDIIVVCANNYNGQLQIFLGKKDGDLSNIVVRDIGSQRDQTSIAAGDFNNDGRLDIVILFQYDSSRAIAVLLGNGDGTFSDDISYLFNSRFQPQSLSVGDFNNDGRLDFVVANRLDSWTSKSNVGVFLGNGDGTFSDQRTFTTGYYALTQSVAVGYFNNDSLLDIVVANPWNNNIAILFGYGNGDFSAPETFPTGIDSAPTYVSVCDFDKDHHLDVLVVNIRKQTIMIFLGNGNAGFSNQLIYSTGEDSNPVWLSVGDFNKDSLIDIATVNDGTKNLGVMYGVIGVNFKSKDTFSTGSSPGPKCLVMNDFNHDNQLDIAVANYITNNVDILYGHGDGSFAIQISCLTGLLSSPTSIIVNDFNNDMELDIAVANSGTNNIGVFYGYGNGTFGSQTIYPITVDSNVQSIAHDDFNHDNQPDIIIANYGKDTIDILVSSDGGRFAIQASYSTGFGSNPLGMVVGDVNNDTILDIIVVNNANGIICVFIGNSDGSFSAKKDYIIGDNSYPTGIALGDFNNDTRLDIVVVENVAYKMVIFLQDKNGDFYEYQSYDTGYNSWPGTVVIADLNRDQRLDIVVGNYQSSSILIFAGYGDGTFDNLGAYQTGNGAGLRSIAIADLNGDDQLDMAIANTNHEHIGVFLGNGDGSFYGFGSFSTDRHCLPVALVISDVDNDNRLDIVVANVGTDNIGIFFGYGNGSFENQVTLSTGSGSEPSSVAVVDLNKDGRLDIIAGNSQLGTVGVLLGFTNRTFFNQIILSNGDISSFPVAVAVGYFNNDSFLDIAVCNRHSATVDIYFGVAGNTFLNGVFYSTGPSSQPNYVITADFNNDTRADVAVANYGTNNIMILLGAGDGTILNVNTYATGTNSRPCWIAIDDLNNDNRLDLVVANRGNDNVGVLIGYGNGTFTSQVTYSTGIKSQPSSVVIGDFDGDSQIDIAVANYGGNTIILLLGYRNGQFANSMLFSSGFNSRPLALTVGRINKDNLTDIAIANNGYGNIQTIIKTC